MPGRPREPKTGHSSPDDPRRFRVMFAGLLLAMGLGALDQTIVTTALPTITGDLNGLEHIAWVVTAYMLAATIGLPVYGKIGDLVGRKPVFIFAIAVFLTGSVLAGASQDVEQLIACRAVQGLGGGGLMIGSLAIIAEVVPPRERGRIMGVIGAVYASASVVGPLVGGYVTDVLGWRWVFYINLPLGILALVTVLLTLRTATPPRGRARHIDVAGTLLLAIVWGSIVLLSTWAGTTFEWASPPIIGLGAVATVGLVAFILVERAAREPTIPLSLFRERNFVFPTLVGMTVSIIMFVTLSYLPLYLQMVNRVDATISGLMLVPMSVGMVISTTITGRLISATGRYRIYPVLGSLLSAVGLYLLSTLDADSSIALLFAATGIVGLGIGCSIQNLTLIAQSSVPYGVIGAATSSQSYFRQIGASLGIALVGAVFVARLGAGVSSSSGLTVSQLNSLTPEALAALPPAVQEQTANVFAAALPPIFIFGVPLALVGVICALFIQQRPLSSLKPGVGEGIGED